MNSDLTLVPLESAVEKSSLMGLVTPNHPAEAGATGQANEKNQTLLDRFRVLICATIKRSEFERFMNKTKTK